MTDEEHVLQFRNFLSWGAAPANVRVPLCAPTDGRGFERHRPVPPVWFAYALGLTPWCPPVGEL